MFRSLSLFFILSCLLLFSLGVEAEEGVWSYTIRDEVGDDYGSGGYQYPENEIFEPYEGLFDIKNFSIRESGDNYILEFEFAKITDPWQSNFGFSLPLIEIYIDNGEGGSTELIEEGANVKLDPDYPWNKMLKLSGWWLLLYNHDTDIDEIVSIDGDVMQSKWQVEDSEVKRKDNLIRVKLPREEIGEMSNSHIQLLVGSFDPFGPGHFREVSDEPSNWKFHAQNLENPDRATRVIDTILPENINQEQILAKDNDKLPQMAAIKLKKADSKIKYNIVQSPFFYLVLIVFITSIIVFKRKA